MSGNQQNPTGTNGTPNELNPNDFTYFSPRDTDGNGIADEVHAVDMDGTSVIFHLDEDGEVVLEEIDSDGDGIFEAQRATLDSDTKVILSDTNKDGTFDQVAYTDAATGQTIQQDQYDAQGNLVETRIDLDGDGKTDVVLRDTTGDGNFDEVSLDSDKDGWVNTRLRDTDGDGKFDEISVDSDNQDGILETTYSAHDYAGGLGKVSDYEGLTSFHDSMPGGLDSSQFDGGVGGHESYDF